MIPEYGMAVVRERTTPARWQDLRILLRQEYGPGTDVGFLQAEIAREAPNGRAPVRQAAERLRRLLRPGRHRAPEPRTGSALRACDGCAPDRR